MVIGSCFFFWQAWLTNDILGKLRKCSILVFLYYLMNVCLQQRKLPSILWPNYVSKQSDFKNSNRNNRFWVYLKYSWYINHFLIVNDICQNGDMSFQNNNINFHVFIQLSVKFILSYCAMFLERIMNVYD